MAVVETFYPPTDTCIISREMNVPKTLFHYTSLENLALILENRTIRLFPLTTLDDPEEQLTADNSAIASRVFVSCWTDDKAESIPMWKLYTKLDSGIRIEMNNDPFVRYMYTEEEVKEILGNIPNEGVAGQLHFLPLELLLEQMCVSHLTGENVLNRIYYTDDEEYIRPTIATVENGQLHIATDKIGRYKNEYWDFQREWRYILVFSPLSLRDLPHLDIASSIAADAMNRNPGFRSMPFYDLHLRQDAIRSMRITTSPKMSPGNKLLLQGLLERMGLETNIQESDLTGKL